MASAFTLVELLVSLTVLVLLVAILASLLRSAQDVLVRTTGQIQKFQDAREAFESVTRRLSQATLNTYWDYDNPNQPTKYIRQSELRFLSGEAQTIINGASTADPAVSPGHAIFFQAPLGGVNDKADYSGRDTLLNTCGYFVEFDSDKSSRPAFLGNLTPSPPPRYRYRLMELVEPSESFALYGLETAAGGNAKYTATTWFTTAMAATPRPVNVVAENIVALLILPKLSPGDQKAGNYGDGALAPSYVYDSTGTNSTTVADPNLDPVNQLPPVVQVTMVAVDETTFNRFQGTATNPALSAPLFNPTGTPLFTDATRYNADLQAMQQVLSGQNFTYPQIRLDYRVFTSNVSLKGAKWSRKQSN